MPLPTGELRPRPSGIWEAAIDSAIEKSERLLALALPSFEQFKPGEHQPMDAAIQHAAVTLVLINLRELLKQAGSEGHAIDVPLEVDVPEKCDSFLDFIGRARNAACHLNTTGLTEVEGNRWIFNIYVGGGSARSGERRIVMPRLEDVGYQIGDMIVLRQRHLVAGIAACRQYYGQTGRLFS